MCPACISTVALAAIGGASAGGLSLFLVGGRARSRNQAREQQGRIVADPIGNLPEMVSTAEWLTARKGLLAKEKELTRAYDAVSAERRRLPMVRVSKDYVFEGSNGKARLADLFEDRSQLIVYHFMFDPKWDEGCPSCTAVADEVSDGRLRHLHARDTTMAMVSRAPLSKLQAYKTRRGWTLPWYSSHGSDFNYDFHVTLDESVAPIEYNFRSKEELLRAGAPPPTQSVEGHGISCFLRDGDTVFHTYSTYARGAEVNYISYHLLDLTALGRQEAWEEPKGRVLHPLPPAPVFSTERR